MRETAKELSGKAAIAGVGFSYWRDAENPKTPLRMIIEACREAILSANVRKKDIDGFFTNRAPGADRDLQYNMKIVNELKIAPKFSSEITIHGSGTLSTIKYATLAITSGLAEYVLCAGGDAGNIWIKDKVRQNAFSEADRQFEAPYGPITPALYAQIAQRHMYEYGTTSAQFAKVAVEGRKWAVKHPLAVMRDKGLITIDDVLKSRMIASPLHILDCAPRFFLAVAGAVLVTRAELAERLTDKPIYILGLGECTTHEYLTDRLGLRGIPPAEEGPNLTTTGTKVAARDAFDMAGITPQDLDILELTAPFSFCVILDLEDLGFCKKGEGGKFVEEGNIDFDGGIPLNTNGGFLSYGQAGPGGPFALITEAIDQMRGKALGRQVEKADIALVTSHGGVLATKSVAILGTKIPKRRN